MLHRCRVIAARSLHWRGRVTGIASVAAMAAAAAVIAIHLSPLHTIRGNNRAAAYGVLSATAIAAAYVAWRALRYARARRLGRAPDAPDGTTAAIEAGRHLGLAALAAELALAPILGRAGHPLWVLGYGEPRVWFIAGVLALASLVAVIWSAGSAPSAPRRLLPRLPPRPDRGP